MTDPQPPISSALPHLLELRSRMLRIVVVYLVGVLLLMNVADRIFAFLAYPLRQALPEGATMVFLNPAEVFFAYFKVSLLASLFATAPYTFYQMWAFVAPGLYREEKRLFLTYFTASVALFLLGAFFAYLLVFPLAFTFFLSFANAGIQAMPAVKEYLNLVLKLLFAFGLSFQIPVLLMFLARMEWIDPIALAKKRRHVIVAAFILGALLTPPDVISQVLLAIPVWALFELGLFLARRGRRPVG